MDQSICALSLSRILISSLCPRKPVRTLGLSIPQIAIVSRLISYSHLLGNINQNHGGDLVSRVRIITGKNSNHGEEIPVYCPYSCCA